MLHSTRSTAVVLQVIISRCREVLFIMLLFLGLHRSISLSELLFIEQEEKSESFRRTQSRHGKYGLHQCKDRKLEQVLPFMYDKIYYCGSDSYICVSGNKCGVYNTKRKGMVIDVCNDYIKILPDGTLDVFRNGNVSRFTADGYRVVE